MPDGVTAMAGVSMLQPAIDVGLRQGRRRCVVPEKVGEGEVGLLDRGSGTKRAP